MARRVSALLLVLCVAFFPTKAFARTKIFGWCQDGGVSVVVPGTTGSGTQRFQQSFRSCTITVYSPGTTNLVTLYANETGTIKANPFTASSNAQWFAYVDVPNVDVKFSGGGISSPFTIGSYISNPTAVLTSFGGKCNGSTNDATALSSAGTALNALGGGNLVVPGGKSCVISSNVTIPATVNLVMESAAKLTSIGNGVTLTINGPFTPAYPTMQAFSTTGSGTVTFSSNTFVRELYVDWWGPTGDCVADDTVYVQAAINALDSTKGGTVHITRCYGIGTAGINVASRNRVVLRGHGTATTGFKQLSNSVLAGPYFLSDILFHNCNACAIYDLEINGNSKLGDPLSFWVCTECIVSGINVHDGSSVSDGGLISSTQGVRNSYLNNIIHDTQGATRGMRIGNTNNDGEKYAIISGNRMYNVHDGVAGTLIETAIIGNIMNNLTGSGAAIAATSGADNVSRHVQFVGNSVKTATFQCVQSDAVAPDFSDYVTIASNTFEDCGNSAVYAVNARHWTITGNSIKGTTNRPAIEIQFAKYMTVTGNIVDSGGNGVEIQEISGGAKGVDQVAVNNNVLYNSNTSGIRSVAANAGSTIENLSLSNNIAIENQEYGINVFNSGGGLTKGVAIGNNVLRDNYIDGTAHGLVGSELNYTAAIVPTVADNVLTAGATSGTVQLSGGTATVATAAAGVGSIVLTRQISAGTIGNLTVGTVTTDTSFVIRSEDSSRSLVADTSTIYWKIIQ